MAVRRTRAVSQREAGDAAVLVATPVLFLLGAALAYYFVFPFAWRFFLTFETPTGGGGCRSSWRRRSANISTW